MYTSEQACYAIALGIITNFFFRSKTIYLVILSILLYEFPYDAWLFMLIESFSYFGYYWLNNGRLPRRMATLNQIWMLCFVVWRQRQVLQLPDAYKLNAFFLSWLLGAVYVKNKIVLIWKLIKKSKQ